MSDIFQVGSTYENMKGVFEVMSINKDTMMIRWDNGTEAVTSVDLQKRIIERMAYEKEQKQLNEKVKEKEIKKAKKQKKKADL